MSARRALTWGAAAALVVVTVIAALTWSGTDAPVRSPGRAGVETAPAFRLEDVRDPSVTVSLADAAGRPVVLNFWASWCVPCRREMPLLERAHRRYGSEVVFIGINHLDARRAAAEFLDETGVTYRSGYDPDGTVAPEYRARGLPETFFISPQGKIVDHIIGELDRDELESAIEKSFSLGAR